jgi:pyruvyltransferase
MFRAIRKLVDSRSKQELLPPVFVWRPEPDGHNFGDSLFHALVNRMTGRELQTASARYSGPIFYPGGSVLHLCKQGDIAWGVGANLNASRWRGRKQFEDNFDIRSVRGPLTASFVKDFLQLPSPVVAGDSALLVPRYFPEWRSIQSQGTIALVRHYADEAGTTVVSDEVLMIDPLRDPAVVVPEILSCELVVSSSLHGIIVAESFGIPARWLKSDTKGPASMKFYDYYLQTGRAPRPAASLEEAVLAGGEPLPDLDDEVLLETFPWDIYGTPDPPEEEAEPRK